MTNKKNLEVAKKVKCFEDCCGDHPCDSCTTYGEIQPVEKVERVYMTSIKAILEKNKSRSITLRFTYNVKDPEEVEFIAAKLYEMLNCPGGRDRRNDVFTVITQQTVPFLEKLLIQVNILEGMPGRGGLVNNIESVLGQKGSYGQK